MSSVTASFAVRYDASKSMWRMTQTVEFIASGDRVDVIDAYAERIYMAMSVVKGLAAEGEEITVYDREGYVLGRMSVGVVSYCKAWVSPEFATPRPARASDPDSSDSFAQFVSFVTRSMFPSTVSSATDTSAAPTVAGGA